jgi:hypothetical protein
MEIFRYVLKVDMPHGVELTDSEIDQLIDGVEDVIYLIPSALENKLRDEVDPRINVRGTESNGL